MHELTVTETIENRIFTIRGLKVMIDKDLAELYGVKTYRLNEAVKRNITRFPADFMFKLNNDELKELIANCDRFKKPLNIQAIRLMHLRSKVLQCCQRF